MSIRLNSGVTYRSRANIFSPVKKNNKMGKFIFEKETLYDKIHEHFSKLESIKLDELGDNEETYGNIIIKGVIYEPKKVKLDYLEKRAREEEEEKVKGKINLNNVINFDDIDSKFEFVNCSVRKSIKKSNIIIPRTSKIHLPLLRNKNKSTGNIHTKKFNNVNFSKIYKNKNININTKTNTNTNKNINNNSNNININSYKDKNIKINPINFSANDINKDIIYNNSNSETNINSLNSNEETDREKEKENKSKIIKNKSQINLKKELKLPILHNKINITNKNVKLYLLANKLSVKTDDNKISQLLKRNKFIKRYDDTTGLNNKLNELNNNIIKINESITRVIDKNNEDIPQFNLRFNHLFRLFDK